MTTKPKPKFYFEGPGVTENDAEHLGKQLIRVKTLMSDGQWRTVPEIVLQLGQPLISETGASARLRDLRKPRFGGHTVERRRRGGPDSRLYEYRLLLAPALAVVPASAAR